MKVLAVGRHCVVLTVEVQTEKGPQAMEVPEDDFVVKFLICAGKFYIFPNRDQTFLVSKIKYAT